MTKEERFQENVNLFLEVVKNCYGSSPIFSINYRREEINLVDSSSGFINELQTKGATTHLHKGLLSVNFY
jgi:hypothetical protein